MKKNIILLLMVLFGVICFGNTSRLTVVKANTINGTAMQLNNDATAYELKDTSSEVFEKFAAGSYIFVVEADEEWVKIAYKGEFGYIPLIQIGMESIAGAEKSVEEMGQDIADEIDKLDHDTSLGLDNYWRKQRQQRNALIWKIAISILVVAIIVVSVIIGIKSSKSKADNEEKDA